MFNNDILHPVPYWNEILDKRLQDEINNYYQKKILQASKLNPSQCADDADEIEDLDNKINKLNKSNKNNKNLFIFLLVFGILGLIVGIIGMVLCFSVFNDKNKAYYFIIPLVVGVTLLPLIVIPKKKMKDNSDKLKIAQGERDEKYVKLVTKLYPLTNNLDSDVVFDLLEKLIPPLKFDSFLSVKNSKVWDKYIAANNDRSMMNCFSGSIKQNPFIVTHAKHTGMFPFTYSGTVVRYATRTRTVNGRTETYSVAVPVTATVVLPAPKWWETVTLYYLNNAASELCFANAKAFKDEKSAIKFFSKNNKMSAMDNPAFDRYFPCKRNDEIAFRTLFSPLAQENIVELFKIRNDYSVEKNFLLTTINSNEFLPSKFNYSLMPLKREFDIRKIEKMFFSILYEFIKNIYWMFAPILSIPLYQQYESRWTPPKKPEPFAIHENEALINKAYNPSIFNHPSCETQNILKCETISTNDDGTQIVNVTAHGYKMNRRIEVVTIVHPEVGPTPVPVPVIDYIQVAKTSQVYNAFIDANERDFYVNEGKILAANNLVTLCKVGDLVTARPTTTCNKTLSLDDVVDVLNKKFI